MSRDIERGLRWRKMIARIAERQAKREKPPVSRSTPSSMPAEGQFALNVGVGSPGVFSTISYFPTPGDLSHIYPGWQIIAWSFVPVREWPTKENDFLVTLNSTPPMVTPNPELR